MRKVLTAAFLMMGHVSFGQASGIYNGDLNEHCLEYFVGSACGNTFKCVYNWYQTGGAPQYDGSGIFTMRAGLGPYGYVNNGVTGAYIFEPGKTHIIEFRYRFTSSLTGSSIKCLVYATKNRRFHYYNSSSCGIDKFTQDPDNDTYVGEVENFNSTGWQIAEMQFTPNEYGNSYIWIFPQWNSTTYGNLSLDLDYVRVRQCGTGTITIANQVLPQAVYAKEHINLGANITFPFVARTFVGQEIIFQPGFATPANYTGAGLDMTAVSTCLLPVQPPVVSKPGHAVTVSGEEPAAEKEITIYPNPAQDYVDVMYPRDNPEYAAFTIMNLTGGVMSRTYRNPDPGQSGMGKERINISALSPGAYLLQFKNGGKMKTLRFIKL